MYTITNSPMISGDEFDPVERRFGTASLGHPPAIPTANTKQCTIFDRGPRKLRSNP
jgi:hypothetical protein